MPPMIEAYHVSRSPNLTVLDPRALNSRERDGLLYGFSAVSLTTTRYHGGLPTISPYPEDAEPGTYGYRYTMRFELEDYDIFELASTSRNKVTQVRLLLLHRVDAEDVTLSAFIRSWHPELELVRGDRNRHFPSGQANQYRRTDVVFVNVHFTSSKPVVYTDRVVKGRDAPVFFPQPVTINADDDRLLTVAFAEHQVRNQPRELPDNLVAGLENLDLVDSTTAAADGNESASEPEDEAQNHTQTQDQGQGDGSER